MPPKAAPKAAAPKAAAKPAAKPQAKPQAKAAPAKAAAPAAKKASAPQPAAGSGNGVYIRGLTNESVADVKALFASAGNIADVRLRRNKYALVWFDNNAGATKAIQQFNAKSAGSANKQLTVTAARAAPKKDAHAGAVTVFVSPVFRQSTTRKQVRAIFEGTGKVTKLRTYRKNFAMVRFADANGAAAAIKKLNGTKYQNKTLTVKPSVRR